MPVPSDATGLRLRAAPRPLRVLVSVVIVTPAAAQASHANPAGEPGPQERPGRTVSGEPSNYVALLKGRKLSPSGSLLITRSPLPAALGWFPAVHGACQADNERMESGACR
jgi:hypothetical protein